MAQDPEKYPMPQPPKMSKREARIILAHAQRWRQEGQISREEYDRLTELCLGETGPIDLPEQN